VTEQGHLTDRYAKAIEHLGSATIDVRLGGIYALERIAHDSPRVQDQATIVEVLSAFVRVHSDPVYRLRKDQPELKPESKEHERELAAKHVEAERFPIDVQAALTVLGRLPRRASWRPLKALGVPLSSTSTLLPAARQTSVGLTPGLSHAESAAWRGELSPSGTTPLPCAGCAVRRRPAGSACRSR
jgi:hypothetical protein